MDMNRRALFFGRKAAADPMTTAGHSQSSQQSSLSSSQSSSHFASWFDIERATPDACLECDACVTACPTSVLEIGPKNLVQTNFQRGECEFCGACTEACPRGLYQATTEEQRQATPPWMIHAAIQDNCLSQLGVVCEICKDLCAYDAIRLNHRLGQPPEISIATDLCSGCGACLAPCPNQAIAIRSKNTAPNSSRTQATTTQESSA